MMLKPVFVLLFVCTVVCNAGNVLQLLKNRATHSQFAELLESTEGVHKHYMEGYLTLFAPSNTALNQYKGDRNKALLLNHIASAFPHSNLQTVNTAISEDELEERLTSLLQGHPPLWVRRKNSELYVNQAKVSLVLPVTTDTGNKQFLYLIDSVLEPLIPQAENSVADYVDIKAGDILNNTQKYKLGEYSIEKYTEQIRSLGIDKFPEFGQYGKYTFFLPVDSAFQGLDKGLVDQEVVRSHIVPGNLLFTQPSSRQGQYSELFPSLQYKQVSMEVKVGVSMYESDDGSIKVQSQTMTGNRNHPRGQVISTVVKGNIPVQNGVLHLIDRPLIILSNTLWESLDPSEKANKRFSRFAEYLLKNPELLEKIKNIEIDDTDDTKNGATLFVPTNAAFDELARAGLENKLETNPELLGFHLVNQIIESSDIRIHQPQSSTGMFGPGIGYPEDTKKKVWMWSNKDEDVFVDGGGVTATIVDSNIRTTNGIIHQVDKVLGVPLTTVLHKIKTDPMLTSTFALGEQEHFNTKLGNPENNITYLVPSDQAWSTIKHKYSSAFKVLFMGRFFYQAHHILERHIKIGEKLSLADILEKGSMSTLRGSPLKFSKRIIEGEEVTVVSYDDIEARVVRGDLECSNGYIHIIDTVVMKRRDVTLSGGWVSLPSLLAMISALLLSAIIQ